MSTATSSSTNVTTSSSSNHDLPAQSNRLDRYLLPLSSVSAVVDDRVPDGRPLLSDADPPALERSNLEEKTDAAPRFTMPDDWHGPVIAIDQLCCMDYRCRNTPITPGVDGATDTFCRKHSGTGMHRGFTTKATHMFAYEHQKGGKHFVRKPNTMRKQRKERISDLDEDVRFTGVTRIPPLSLSSHSTASSSSERVAQPMMNRCSVFHSNGGVTRVDWNDAWWHSKNVHRDKWEHCCFAGCEKRAVHYGWYVGDWRFGCEDHRVHCQCVTKNGVSDNIVSLLSTV